MVTFLSYLHINPNRIAFEIPFIHHPIAWYGILFALGFIWIYGLSIFIFASENASRTGITSNAILDEKRLKKQLQKAQFDDLKLKFSQRTFIPLRVCLSSTLVFRRQAVKLVDQLITYTMVGVVVGARIGYICFYGWPLFLSDPTEAFILWNGGLSSHGACLGFLMAIALYLYRSRKKEAYFRGFEILDVACLVSGFLAFFIRLGNFINQEILGIPTKVFWAIIFENPLDQTPVVPRHPVQLYEALFYFSLALVLVILWRTRRLRVGEAKIAGVFITAVFLFRFLIEFLKEHQGWVIDPKHNLQMGQYLSLPFILMGTLLIFKSHFSGRMQHKKSQL